MINNSLIQYGDFKVYTSDKILLIVKILIIERLSKENSNSSLLNHLIHQINSNSRLDIDKIDTELKSLNQLQDCLNSIYKRIKQEGIYYTSNEFAHEIFKILINSLDKKTTTKIIGELNNRFDKVLLDELVKIIRISYKDEPFKTETNLSLDNLKGNWSSIKIENTPDYEINWNMTDYTVSRSQIKLEITQDKCSVIVPALDYTTKSEILLSLIQGNLSLNNGNLIIERENLKREIPVLELNDDVLTLFIFKTKVQFKKQ